MRLRGGTWGGIACSTFALFISGCVQSALEDTEGTTHVDSAFSVLDVSSATSILPVVEARRGALRVCLALIGFGAETAAANTKMSAVIKSAIGEWNDLLVGNPDWAIPTTAPVITVQVTECGGTTGDMRVNVWKDASTFTTDYCGRRPTWICSSAGSTSTRTVYIGPVNRGVPEDVFDPYTLRHEYGHMIGLGDTYRIAGSHDWVGTQPPSVMNRGSLTLTDDDKFGLWVTLRTVKTGSRSCDDFGTEQAMTSNVWRSIMCDSSTRPVTTDTPAVTIRTP